MNRVDRILHYINKFNYFFFKQTQTLYISRFCGRSRPKEVLISETNDMMVTFRSNYMEFMPEEDRHGFKASFVAGRSLFIIYADLNKLPPIGFFGELF